MYVFQKFDEKYELWADALHRLGVETAAVRGSPIHAPVHLLRHVLGKRRPRVYVFRYLNDYPSTAKTLLRFLSEVTVIAGMKAIRGRILWIAHNVDGESDRYHPRISALRRRMVSRVADSILVTDPLLIPHAQRTFPRARQIDWVCFGQPRHAEQTEDTVCVQEAARQLRGRLEERWAGREVYVGLCVSSPGTKYTHFLHVCDFVERCSTGGVVVGVVLGGDKRRITHRR
jgi:hypothetical protein